MTDEDPGKTDEDPIEGEGTEPGKRVGAGLPDEGIKGKGEDDLGDSDTGEGEAGPASGTTESDSVGPV